MPDWNVVVTVENTEGFRAARRILQRFGPIGRTDYRNVLAMRVDDIAGFLEQLDALLATDKSLLNSVARILPAQVTFDFATPDALKAKAQDAVREWSPRLKGQRFHVRFHRRGHRGDLPSLEIEQLLDDAVIKNTTQLGSPARISFSDPDFVIDIETITDRAGLSLWSRDELKNYPFLRID